MESAGLGSAWIARQRIQRAREALVFDAVSLCGLPGGWSSELL
jgi:hypothetical protein